MRKISLDGSDSGACRFPTHFSMMCLHSRVATCTSCYIDLCVVVASSARYSSVFLCAACVMLQCTPWTLRYLFFSFSFFSFFYLFSFLFLLAFFRSNWDHWDAKIRRCNELTVDFWRRWKVQSQSQRHEVHPVGALGACHFEIFLCWKRLEETRKRANKQSKADRCRLSPACSRVSMLWVKEVQMAETIWNNLKHPKGSKRFKLVQTSSNSTDESSWCGAKV